MVTSSSERTVVLTTNNPEAEILLLNGAFEVVSRGLSPLQATAPIGLYAMKVKVGDEESEALFALPPDALPFEWHLDAPMFESPIPLDATSTTHEYHQDAVSKFLGSEAPSVNVGAGSAVMVCVRDPSRRNFAVSGQSEVGATGEQKLAYGESFTGFSLLDAKGKEIANLDTQGTLRVSSGYLAIRVEVDPGSYALAYRQGSETVCFSLATAADWTTQVFLNVLSADSASYKLVPDLAGMAIVFERSSAGFSAWRRELVAEETIRQSLLDGRSRLSESSMQILLDGKFENPMFGLYAAYMLLDEKPPRAELAATVVQNTKAMLGEAFPDIVALGWAVAKARGVSPSADQIELLRKSLAALRGPPVLVRSWDVLLEASKLLAVSESSAIPVFSFAGDLVGQGGIFLAWSRRAYEARRSELPAASGSAGGASAPSLDAPLARSLPGSIQSSNSSRSITSVVTDLVGPVISAVYRATKLFRRVRKEGDELPLAARIAAAENEEQAAAVMSELAGKYPWAKLLPELRKHPASMAGLSGLQRDLLLTMRDAASESDEPIAMDAAFVRRLLEAHRIPLSSLVDALADIEISGWLASGARELVGRGSQAVQKGGQAVVQRLTSAIEAPTLELPKHLEAPIYSRKLVYATRDKKLKFRDLQRSIERTWASVFEQGSLENGLALGMGVNLSAISRDMRSYLVLEQAAGVAGTNVEVATTDDDLAIQIWTGILLPQLRAEYGVSALEELGGSEGLPA